MSEKFYTTGEVAAMLNLPLSKVDYACAKGKAGALSFVGGRRALTAANIRELAKHFGKVIPVTGRDSEMTMIQTNGGNK